MNTPNPLVPQGSLREQSKRKSQVRLIFFSILAVHLLVLGALLIQGCKREEPTGPKIESPPSLADTSPVIPPPPTTPSNPLPVPPPVAATSAAPVTTASVTEPPHANPTEHVIAKGETFAILAKKYGVSVKAIQQANPGVDSTKLKISQKINIPPKPPGGPSPATSGAKATEPEVGVGETLYTVKSNDTLTKIAKAHGLSIKALRTANNLRTDQLKPGQKLKIPSKGAAAAPETPAASTGLTPPPAAAATSAPVVPPGP